MSDIPNKLDKTLRDVQLAYYLKKIAPSDATKNTFKLKTIEELSEFWLLNVQVSLGVSTSSVACAVASLQQYIHRILYDMEPGYGTATKTAARVKIWTDEMRRYSIWVGHQKLSYYPEVYLDPSLRNTDSDNFNQLKNNLDQSRIQPEAIESAVKSYLTRFEEVSNLNILNGYIDGTDFSNSTYYFIAKSRSEPTYFWRSLNMAERPPRDKELAGKKHDHPEPYAWSDWKKADIAIPHDAIEHTIRPVWFNNRLFVTWAQCIHQDPAGVTKDRRDPQLLVSYCYKRTDDTWSTAQTILNNFVNNDMLGNHASRPVNETPLSDLHPDKIKSRVNTVAIQYKENSQDVLLIAIVLYGEHRELLPLYTPLEYDLFSRSNRDTQKNNTTPLFLSSASINKNFTHIPGLHHQNYKTTNSRSLPHYKLAYNIHKHPINKLSSPVIYLQSKHETHHALKVTTKPIPTTTFLLPKGLISHSITYHTPSQITISLNLNPKLLPTFSNLSNFLTSPAPALFIVRSTDLHPPPRFGSLLLGEYSHHFLFDRCDLLRSSEIFHFGLIGSESDQYWYSEGIEVSVVDGFSTPKLSNSNSVQYLDFSDSLIFRNDVDQEDRQPIRLNTLLATELTGRAENSLDELFSRETQQLLEPKIFNDDSDQPMDFHGPNGRYYAELFLNLPWLIAHRLNAEGQYVEAERWIKYLFDPRQRKSDCWRTVPLTGTDVPSYAARAPHDPHMISQSYPVHARKALYLLYLDILINRGDAAYRELTPDSLVEAKQWYTQASTLLGSRPDAQLNDQWSTISLKELSAIHVRDLRELEKTLSMTSPLKGGVQPTRPTTGTSILRVPFNRELLKRWDTVETRLNNLRNNIDIKGEPLHLPLFVAPMDPRVLVSLRESGVSYGANSQLRKPVLWHYRFTAMHSQALIAVDSVIQFGATLVSLIERQEQAHLQEQQQQQAWDTAKISVMLQNQALIIDRKNDEFLNAGKKTIQGRLKHYEQLLEKDVTPEEAEAGRLYLSSATEEMASASAQVLAGVLMLIPNVFGLANGGSRWEGTAYAASAFAQLRATQDRAAATNLDRNAQFARRREEWTFNRDQARLELAQVEAQIAQFSEQKKATQLQLKQAETTLSQAKDNYDFLSQRFTNKQLYQWLNNQFTTLYEQAYETTLDLCLAAEACWQYERADYTTRFIQPGKWNSTYRGLSAGESLKSRLMTMQAELLKANSRDLEITKNVSLKALKDKDKTSKINRTWKQIHTSLLEEGSCDFELTHKMFEDDWKGQGHYLRRIKTLSVTVPGVVDPYENIRATLTQTSSSMYLSTDTKEPSIKDLRVKQQVALSTGDEDSGLFTLNLLDERYLPFEYTGAVSTWRLTFPNHSAQKTILESMTDIIVHVRYTVKRPGVSR